ncbi:hypothetical protein LEP1GSC016_0736 [Leptospira borgpetersenii serovar Hardjo-bovis str. Sponselee]|uniref:Uncharacterized protein n=2 Tax=Leptospira borgpetersenii TaxID=174 RepID=M6BI84_LEPBO|nr:hypothetical protein LEP1GSC016_0736 [Leptospira borgpetersenii serovar Hardjo-bovis str. Sponselee]EMO64849.1 hypothetical protein LEP1GSC133_2789 [Leptospira borgpetersenii serovar Pomona str. 200901868]
MKTNTLGRIYIPEKEFQSFSEIILGIAISVKRKRKGSILKTSFQKARSEKISQK